MVFPLDLLFQIFFLQLLRVLRAVRFLKNCMPVAFYQVEIKNLEKGGIDKKCMMNINFFIAIIHRYFLPPVYPCKILYFGKFLFNVGPIGNMVMPLFAMTPFLQTSALRLTDKYFFLEIVKASFIKNKKHDHNTGGHAYSKTNYIDRGINFILPQISPRGFKIIFDHNFYVLSIVNGQLSIRMLVFGEPIHYSPLTIHYLTLFVTISQGLRSLLLLPGSLQ